MSVSQKGSQTLTTTSSGSQPLRKRRQAALAEKKIGEDEFMAAAIGDVEWLKQSLKDARDKKVNFDKHGLAAVHLAAIHGRIECLRWLITKHKTDVNQPSETGWRPVHLCISNQTGKRAYQCLSFLLEKGANPSVENDDLVTPVHQASTEGHVQCLKALLEADAKIDGRDKHGNTPLDLAKLWGHRKCARLLASELWHRDKDFWSKEMQQLEKVKMMQVLNQFAAEDELAAEKMLCENETYEQWKESKSAKTNKGQKAAKEKPPQNPKRVQSGGESLHKPNSQRASGGESARKPLSLTASRRTLGTVADSIESIVEVEEPDSARRLQVVRKSDVRQSSSKGGQAGKSAHSQKAKPLQSSTSWRARHTARWAYSKRPSDLEYVPALKDVYPRDPYSALPDKEASPEYLRAGFQQLRAVSEQISRQGTEEALRMPKLPADVIKKRLYGEPSLQDRPVVFKCKNMIDVPEKRKFGHDLKPRDEIMFHLTDNIHTELFKESVSTPRVVGAVPRSAATSSVALSQGTQEALPVRRLAQQLSRFGTTDPFPALKGDYYDVSRDHVLSY